MIYNPTYAGIYDRLVSRLFGLVWVSFGLLGTKPDHLETKLSKILVMFDLHDQTTFESGQVWACDHLPLIFAKFPSSVSDFPWLLACKRNFGFPSSVFSLRSDFRGQSMGLAIVIISRIQQLCSKMSFGPARHLDQYIWFRYLDPRRPNPRRRAGPKLIFRWYGKWCMAQTKLIAPVGCSGEVFVHLVSIFRFPVLCRELR